MSLQTSAAFRQYYMDGRAPLVRAVLRLADDTTVQVGGDRIMVGGLSVTGATSPASDFSIGSAIVGTATVTLANYDGWLDLLDLEGATLLAYAGAEVAGGTEWALLGTYDVDAPTTRGMTYPLQCRDWMGRFEVAYSEVTTAYPATLATIVSDICSHVGVTLATQTFTNSSHVVQARPTDELSCIDMLGFVAQLACSYARMTPDGRLSLGWYDPDAFGGGESWLDGGTFSGSQTPYADGDAANGGAFMTGGDTASGGTFDSQGDYSQVSAIRSLTTGAMDVTITGLRVTAQDEVVTEGEGAEGESYQYGQDGYVLAIEGNPLVPYGSAQAVAAMVAPYVVGLSFRPLDSDVIGDPSLQAGDAMVVTDRLGRTYRTYVTQATWSSGGSQRLACGAQAPSRRAMSRTGVVTRAIKAVNDAVRRVTSATQAARQVADEARSVADAIGQHFWTGDDGVHVTQVTQESWETSPLGPNLLANALGILLRTGLNNLVSVTQSAIAFYDGLGNAASNIYAMFGRAGSRIGYESETHVSMTDTGMSLTTPGSATGFDIALGDRVLSQFESTGGSVTSVPFDFTLSYTPQQGSIRVSLGTNGRYTYPAGEDSYSYTASGKVVTVTDQRLVGSSCGFSYTATDVKDVAMTVGSRLSGEPVGPCSSAIGEYLVSSGKSSHAEGIYNSAIGSASHVEGRISNASGAYSHAEGEHSSSVGLGSHAEGRDTMAGGLYSHAEGRGTTAMWEASHAEGCDTQALAEYSHAGGLGTIAVRNCQTVIGKYNKQDTGDVYALIIGNGTGDSSRSDALAVEWDGGIHVAGSSYAIGDIVSADSTISLESGDGTGIAYVSLPPGTWLIEGNVGFASNATGRRIIDLATSDGSVTADVIAQTGVEVPAVSGGMTALHTTWITRRTSRTNVYINAWQNSGGSLSATGYIRAVCIG